MAGRPCPENRGDRHGYEQRHGPGGEGHCPQARVVYDLFHVIAKFGREVIDRVRVDEANRLRESKPRRQVIKQSRWLPLRNRDNLQDHQRIRLDELLDAYRSLMLVYLMKDQLKSP